jgi:hypothetical protein
VLSPEGRQSIPASSGRLPPLQAGQVEHEQDGGADEGKPALSNNSREACHRFFEWAPQHLEVQDPAGYTGSLGPGSDFIKRGFITDALRTPYDRSGRALDAESKENHAEAIRLWRIIFGSEFPAYG